MHVNECAFHMIGRVSACMHAHLASCVCSRCKAGIRSFKQGCIQLPTQVVLFVCVCTYMYVRRYVRICLKVAINYIASSMHNQSVHSVSGPSMLHSRVDTVF